MRARDERTDRRRHDAPPSAMLRAMRILVALLLVAVAAGAAAALGGSRVYRNDAWRVRSFEVPRSWESAPQASYPAVLLLAVGPDGAHLSLAAQRIARGVRARGMAEAAAASLGRQGFREVRVADEYDGRARLDATYEGGRSSLRQIYVVAGDLGFIVTLTAGSGQVAHLVKDLDEAARSLQIGSIAAPLADAGAADAVAADGP